MGKLVNPFASHAKDPRFEPEWNHVLVLFCLLFLLFQQKELTEVSKTHRLRLCLYDLPLNFTYSMGIPELALCARGLRV